MRRRHIKNDFTKSIWQTALDIFKTVLHGIWNAYVKHYNFIMFFTAIAGLFIIGHTTDPYYERTMIRNANLLFTACAALIISFPWKKLELISLPFIVYVIIYFVVYWDEMKIIFEQIGNRLF